MSEKSPFEARKALVVLHGVKLPFGLEVERVQFNGEGLTVRPEPFQFESKQPATFEATLTDLAIQAFLEHKSPGGLRDFFVQLSEGKFHVHATARVLIEIRAAVTCNLEIVEKKQIFIRLEKVDVLGVGAKRLVQKQLDEINPIVDVRDFAADVLFDSVEVGQGTIDLKGTIAQN